MRCPRFDFIYSCLYSIFIGCHSSWKILEKAQGSVVAITREENGLNESKSWPHVTEQKELLELEMLDLENKIKSLLERTPRLRPPQHVLHLASTIRAQTARQKGTIVSFNDSYLVLKVYANFVLSPQCQSHTEAVEWTTTALQMSRRTVFDIVKQCSEVGGNIYELSVGGNASSRGCGSDRYSYDHSIFTKEILIWAHQEVMRMLKKDKKYSSCADIHRLVEERYDLNSTCNGLRRAMEQCSIMIGKSFLERDPPGSSSSEFVSLLFDMQVRCYIQSIIYTVTLL